MTSALANLVRTIRLDEAQLKTLFDRLDARADGADAREHQRFLYRHKIILVRIEQPGDGEPTNFVCPTRNVSRGGLACLHGGYIHVGSAVVAHLRTTRGGFDGIPGFVARCEHVRGNIHDVGIRFDYWIDPARYCHEAVRYQALMLVPDKTAADALRRVLDELSCNVAVAESPNQLMDLVGGGIYDLIVVDVSAGGEESVAAIRALRERGATDPVMAAHAAPTDDVRARLLSAGCDHVFALPIDPAAVAGVVKPLLSAPIHSTLKTDRRTEAVLSTFLKSLPRKMRELERAAVAGDNRLSALLHSFRQLTVSLGFDSIAGEAESIARLAGSAPEAAVLRAGVANLAALCRRMRS
jgi:CheY-like chemotaxis protein